MNQIKATACKPNQMDYSFEKNSISQCEKKCLAFRGLVRSGGMTEGKGSIPHQTDLIPTTNKKVALFVSFYPIIDNDYNIKLIKRLNTEGILVEYMNFFENTSLKYRQELTFYGNQLLLKRKSKFNNKHLRMFFNLIGGTFFVLYHALGKYRRYNYIFTVDYQLNLLLYFLEMALLKKSKRFYILQELYQFDNKKRYLRKFIVFLDKYSQRNCICLINRNDLRKDFIDKINQEVSNKQIVIYNVPEKYIESCQRKDIHNLFNILYAGSIRRGLMGFILEISCILFDKKINFNMYIYGLNDEEKEYWKKAIKTNCPELVESIYLNSRVENDYIISRLKNTHLGILYYHTDIKATINERLAAPCKLFEYLAASVPVISYGSKFADYLINRYNIGISIEKFGDLKLLLENIFNNYFIYVENIKRVQEAKLFLFDDEYEKVKPFLK